MEMEKKQEGCKAQARRQVKANSYYKRLCAVLTWQVLRVKYTERTP